MVDVFDHFENIDELENSLNFNEELYDKYEDRSFNDLPNEFQDISVDTTLRSKEQNEFDQITNNGLAALFDSDSDDILKNDPSYYLKNQHKESNNDKNNYEYKQYLSDVLNSETQSPPLQETELDMSKFNRFHNKDIEEKNDEINVINDNNNNKRRESKPYNSLVEVQRNSNNNNNHKRMATDDFGDFQGFDEEGKFDVGTNQPTLTDQIEMLSRGNNKLREDLFLKDNEINRLKQIIKKKEQTIESLIRKININKNNSNYSSSINYNNVNKLSLNEKTHVLIEHTMNENQDYKNKVNELKLQLDALRTQINNNKEINESNYQATRESIAKSMLDTLYSNDDTKNEKIRERSYSMSSTLPDVIDLLRETPEEKESDDYYHPNNVLNKQNRRSSLVGTVFFEPNDNNNNNSPQKENGVPIERTVGQQNPYASSMAERFRQKSIRNSLTSSDNSPIPISRDISSKKRHKAPSERQPSLDEISGNTTNYGKNNINYSKKIEELNDYIESLKKENERICKSKMSLAKATSEEIDKLRKFIKNLSKYIQSFKRNVKIDIQNHKIGI